MKKQKKLPAFSAVIFAAAVIGFFAACDTGNGGGSSDGAFTDGGSGTPGVSGGIPGSGTSSSGPAVSTDSWENVSDQSGMITYDIASLEVDNTDNSLYVDVEFLTDEILLWSNDRISVVINAGQNKNIDVSKNGASSAEDGANEYQYGIASSASVSADYAWSFSVWQSDDGYSGSKTVPWLQSLENMKTSRISWDENEFTGGPESLVYAVGLETNSIGFVIPMADLGNPAPGTEIKVFAAVSNMWSDGSVALKDGIPAAAISSTSNNDTVLSIDMSRALSYTVR